MENTNRKLNISYGTKFKCCNLNLKDKQITHIDKNKDNYPNVLLPVVYLRINILFNTYINQNMDVKIFKLMKTKKETRIIKCAKIKQ